MSRNKPNNFQKRLVRKKKKKIHLNKGYYAEDEKNEEQLYSLIQSSASDRVMGVGGG